MHKQILFHLVLIFVVVLAQSLNDGLVEYLAHLQPIHHVRRHECHSQERLNLEALVAIPGFSDLRQ